MVGDKNKNNKKNSVEIEAYLKPSWVLASTNNLMLSSSDCDITMDTCKHNNIFYTKMKLFKNEMQLALTFPIDPLILCVHFLDE